MHEEEELLDKRKDNIQMPHTYIQGCHKAPYWVLCYLFASLMTCQHQIHLYADDILLFRQIHSIVDSLALQRDLNAIMKWSEDWQMFSILVSVYTLIGD